MRYDNSESAINSYNEIKKLSELSHEEYENSIEKIKKLINIIGISTKPGGMISQKGNYVFSLVEICRNTPIGGKWEAYENLFLKYITEIGEEINILNADCGDDRYREEKRRLNNN